MTTFFFFFFSLNPKNQVKKFFENKKHPREKKSCYKEF